MKANIIEIKESQYLRLNNITKNNLMMVLKNVAEGYCGILGGVQRL